MILLSLSIHIIKIHMSKILYIILSILYTLYVFTYLYAISIFKHLTILPYLKIVPLCILIIHIVGNIIYNYINYKTILLYSIGIVLTFIFFIPGDILMCLYNINNTYIMYIIGIIMFLMGHIALIIFYTIKNTSDCDDQNIFIFNYSRRTIFILIVNICIPIIIILIIIMGYSNNRLKYIQLFIMILYGIISIISCILSILYYLNNNINQLICSVIGIVFIGISDVTIVYVQCIDKFKYDNIPILILYWSGCLLIYISTYINIDK